MSESITVIQGSKEKKYGNIIPQIKALIEGESDMIANMANLTAILKAQFGWLWIGFYLVKENQLVLGPFQGPVACTRIQYGRGVCGSAWSQKETIIVPDVDKFPGHIACSNESKSEIVIPVWKQDQIIGVLDVDSTALNDFDNTDKEHLEIIVSLL